MVHLGCQSVRMCSACKGHEAHVDLKGKLEVNIQANTHMHLFTYVHICKCLDAHTRAYTHTHTHTYACTQPRTYMHALSLSAPPLTSDKQYVKTITE